MRRSIPPSRRWPRKIVVTQHRVSAFAGTALDMMLRANGIETLILTAIVTSGVVRSTLCHAADEDCWSSAIAALTATRKLIGRSIEVAEEA
jgi:nicotinamidase-related amidase